ncbi:hypothetical protein GWO43_30175 [candidate division KSB1 bacterium]|nr:hypothetical protein [candidate division KSB1 bacterium]NIR72501.1 hypothetical protein [candidate division KSB1 bacterium]NIS28156.1 hypothetical protein [candidate division KSB1 bacterium]NIT75050.1 hypothetical protein [candidate division KSB1 bacterium]NIU28836.1 hypothetical protein [candidate division KSB1 bacterium]
MKQQWSKHLPLFALLGFLTCLWACQSDNSLSSSSEEFDLTDNIADAEAVITGLGNGAPSGAHYNLNIIGVPKDKSADMTGNNGHRIFVKLQGKTKILLYEGEDYSVLDANGTDGKAEFQLPHPDPDSTGITKYAIFARALGKPGGSATLSTCAIDTATDEEFCSVYSTIAFREKGKRSFSDVSKDLLYIYADLDGDGNLERYPLFDEALEGYFWDYDNKGLKLYQMRFYPVPSDVN